MILKSWRLIKPQLIDNAFDGEGAKIFGGRWNNKGVPVIYPAGSLSLAALELLVHLQSHEVLNLYKSIPVEFDSRLVTQLKKSNYPKNMTDSPAPSSTKEIGDEWVADMKSVVFEVPSAIVSEESNYLINPNHPDFSKISIGKAIRFRFDHRLLK